MIPLWRTDRKAAHAIRARDLVTVYAVYVVLPIAALIIIGWVQRTLTPLEAIATTATDRRDPFVLLVSMTTFLMAPGLVFFNSFLRLGLGGVLTAAVLGGIFAALPPADAAWRGHAIMVTSLPLTVVLGALIGVSAWFFLTWRCPDALRQRRTR